MVLAVAACDVPKERDTGVGNEGKDVPILPRGATTKLGAALQQSAGRFPLITGFVVGGRHMEGNGTEDKYKSERNRSGLSHQTGKMRGRELVVMGDYVSVIMMGRHQENKGCVAVGFKGTDIISVHECQQPLSSCRK
jgi:hypothetical protein